VRFIRRVQETPHYRNAGREYFSTAKLNAKIGTAPADVTAMLPRPQWPKRAVWRRSFATSFSLSPSAHLYTHTSR